jgi:hypothetical protein
VAAAAHLAPARTTFDIYWKRGEHDLGYGT